MLVYHYSFLTESQSAFFSHSALPPPSRLRYDRPMKLLEYEAKQIITQFNIPTPYGVVIPKDSQSMNISLPTVLKSQVPIGGRGKLGGVKIVKDPEQFTETVRSLFDLSIKGFTPRTLLAEEMLAIKQEFYLSLLIDRPTATIQLVANKDGGMEVESNDTNSFLKITLTGNNDIEAGEQLAEYFNLPGQTFVLQDLVSRLYTCFVENDALLIEINPLVLTNEGTIVAGDCKMELDDAAAFRHTEWRFEDQVADSNFVTLNEDGAVATIANGAGLAMATVDAVTAKGMTPANFLDIGGGANAESVLAAFTRIMTFPHVQVIVINIFAGITRCDEVAKAIIAAKDQMKDLPPVFIRLAGTNFEEAVQLLDEAGITTLSSLEECLDKAKEVINE